MDDQHDTARALSQEVVQLPAPTAFPIVLALGLTFGLRRPGDQHGGISVLGAVLIVAGCVGWFSAKYGRMRITLRVPVKVDRDPGIHHRVRTTIARIEVDESHRARLPVHTPSVMAGVKGGIAGGVADDRACSALWPDRVITASGIAMNLLGGAGRRRLGQSHDWPRSRTFA